MRPNKFALPPATSYGAASVALVAALAAGRRNNLTAARAVLCASIFLIVGCDRSHATEIPAGFAKAFFVASDGDDKNPGTSAKPFASI